MTTGEIAQFCCETVGDASSPMLDFAKRAIRLKYATLYDAHSWREAQRTLNNVPLDPALGGILFLPYDAEEVISLSFSYDGTNYARLTYRERDWIERFAASGNMLIGNLPWYYRAENFAWPQINPGIMTFTTSDVSPFTVYIEGTDQNDYPVVETLSLNATQGSGNQVLPSSVSTGHFYKTVQSLSKGPTSLFLTVSSAAGQTINVPPGIDELIFTQLVLYPSPLFTDNNGNPQSVFVRTQIKLKPDALSNDMSVPRISHIWDALVEYTLSALYRKVRQVSKANDAEQKAQAHIKAAVNVEKNQSESRQQVVPTVYDTGDYMRSCTAYVSSAYPFGLIEIG